MEMGGNFCQILELGGGTTIKGRRVNTLRLIYVSTCLICIPFIFFSIRNCSPKFIC